MKLTVIDCERAKAKSGVTKLSDGGGLQLWVQAPRGKYWRFAYKYAGKQKVLAIGPYPLVTLEQARAAAARARRDLAEGKDPAALKKAEKEAIAARAVTFRIIADEYVARLRKEGRAANTVSKNEWLLSFAYPLFGDRPISEIKPPQVLEALRSVEARGRLESARRLRSTIGSVFRYAIATARAEIDPTAALQGALLTPKVKPRAAIIDPTALGGLLRAIDSFEGQPATRAALQLMPILFPRPGELRLSEWSEFDFDKAIWTIPAAKMKMRRPHRVPLPRQAVEILRALGRSGDGAALAFPSLRTPERPISDGAMIAAIRRLGFGADEVCPHGFRATASTLLNESGLWHPDAIERQLAHVESNDVRRAYTRGEHWEERVRMMTWWADYLDALKADGGRPAPAVHSAQTQWSQTQSAPPAALSRPASPASLESLPATSLPAAATPSPTSHPISTLNRPTSSFSLAVPKQSFATLPFGGLTIAGVSIAGAPTQNPSPRPPQAK